MVDTIVVPWLNQVDHPIVRGAPVFLPTNVLCPLVTPPRDADRQWWVFYPPPNSLGMRCYLSAAVLVLSAVLLVCRADASSFPGRVRLADDNVTADAASGSCYDCAIAWQQEQFRAHAQPYAGLCLGFVHDAFAHCGVTRSYLNEPSAAAATVAAEKEPGWHYFTSPDAVPRGAVLLWAHCGNQPYGHAVLGVGNGHASSSGEGNWNGSPDVAIKWLSSYWCGHNPSGWILTGC